MSRDVALQPLSFFQHDVRLARYTSWRIGGPARFFADVTTPDDLQAALAWVAVEQVPVLVLGGGSNTLIRDAGFAGLVLRYRAQEVHIAPEAGGAIVRIDAGAPMAGTARRLARQGLAGLEWAEGLPGTIGGAVYGNAGCYGGDVAANLQRAWLLVNGEVETWDAARLGYGYRTSVLKRAAKDGRWEMGDGRWRIGYQASSSPIPNPQSPSPIILAAAFRLANADPAELSARMAETSVLRRSKSPSGQSCGSVFKNPPNDSAGRVLEAAGLKGARVGGAAIAEKHANYIINQGGATSDDVLRLIDMARERVAHAFGIALELEVQIV